MICSSKPKPWPPVAARRRTTLKEMVTRSLRREVGLEANQDMPPDPNGTNLSPNGAASDSPRLQSYLGTPMKNDDLP